MFIRVQGSVFKRAVKDLITGTGASINLSIHGDKLRLQTAKNIVLNKYVDILEKDSSTESVTAFFDGSIELIADNEVLSITLLGESLELKQATFRYSTFKETEETIECDFVKQQEIVLNSAELSSFLYDVRAMELINKDVGGGLLNFDVFNKRAVVGNFNTMYSRNLQFIDSRINSNYLKYLIQQFSGSLLWGVDTEKRMLKAIKGDSDIIVPYTLYDKKNIVLFDELCNEVKSTDCRINFAKYKNTINILCKVYKKVLMDLTICKDGCIIFVDDTVTKFVTGDGTEAQFTIRVSVSQLNMINRVMGDCNDVEVLKGVDKICLRSKNYNKTLIIAGTIY